MKSLTNLRKGLALVLCAAMLMGDTTMLQAAQVESTTVGAVVSESKAETEVAEDVPTEEVEQEQEEAEVLEPQAEATEVSEAEEKSEETQVEAADVETALENKALEATYTATVGETTVTVVAPEGAFTEEVTLQVTEVEITDEMQAQLDEQAIAEQKAINSASAYDISFVNAEGKEIEPAKEVQVSIATAEVNSGDDASVYHFDEEKAAVADMDATVVESGDVAFGTDHFSTYVIVNKGGNTVKVTIHHERVVGENTEAIYKTDERNLPVGARITDYTKATNWNPIGAYTYENNGWVWHDVDYLGNIEVTSDFEVWVRYTPKEQEYKGEVTFWDYVVKPSGQTYYIYQYKVKRWGTEYNHFLGYEAQVNTSVWENSKEYKIVSGPERIENTDLNALKQQIANTKNKVKNNYNNAIITGDGYGYSINYIDNFKKDSTYKANRPSLTMGKTDQNYEFNKHNDSLNNKKINDYDDWDETKKDPIKNGIINGVDKDGNVIFNVNQPGLFTTTPSVGKTVYNQGEYYLTFRRVGDTYEFASANKKDGSVVATAGSNFWPLKDAASNVDDQSSAKNQNDFYGMRYDVSFSIGDYVGDLNYTFSGDDDLWVVLDNNKVVIDLGGIHKEQSATVDLWDYIEGGKDNCDRAQIHTLTILYLERGATASNCTMKFTVPHAKIVDYTTPMADLELTKVNADDDTEKLAGATFQLQNNTVENDHRTFTTEDDGKARFNGLIEGVYTLTETAAPEGYDLPDTTWTVRVTVNEDGKTATAKLYDADGNEVTDNVITNKKHEEEPVVPTYNSSKTVKVTNYDKREYEITLTAKSTTQATSTTTSGGPVDVMLLVDASASMLWDGGSVTTKEYVDKGKLSSNQASFTDRLELSGECFVKVGENYYKVQEQVNENGGFLGLYDTYSYYYFGTNGNKVSIGGKTHIYQYEDLTRTYSRGDALKASVEQFLTSMSEKSPKSKVGIVGFCSEGSNHYSSGKIAIQNLSTIGTDPIPAIQNFNDKYVLYENCGTSPDIALSEAKSQFNNAKDGRKKIVVLFTDGLPTGNRTDGTWESKTPSEDAATALKNDKVTIYTVGFALGDEGKNWLSNYIATSPAHALTADTQEELTKIFESISQTITNNLDIENATITDVLDPRFELVETPEGATVSADGRTITWTGQTIPYKENWTKTIKIRAKADFLGGNKIPTNIAPQSGITIGEGTTPEPFENQPTVNVKLLNLTGAADEETVFLGDSIDASNLDKTLAKAIKANGTELLQNPTFNAQGKITVDYIYPGTTDKVGTITFTKKAEGEGAAFTKHDAEYIGSPAELYTVIAEYKPLAPNERPKDLTATAADGGAVVTTSATATATHKVNVVAGTVTIQKTIAKKDYKKELGDPIFTFELTNTTTGKVYYKTLRFKEVEEGLFNETLEATIEGLPKGTYTVEELDTMGFTFKSLNVDGYNKKVEGKVGTFTLELNHDKATATYANKLTHSPRDTDTDVVKNSFKLNGKTSSTVDADNGNTADVGKHTTLKITNEGGNQ